MIFNLNRLMNYLKILSAVFIAVAATRLIPHPPNFTSLIALSFYLPAFFGYRFIPAIIISFAITDLVIGFHGLLLFTWGSAILIGLLSHYFHKSLKSRIFGALSGAIIFFIITNFGVWLFGSYGYTLSGLIACYILAIPFFANTVISTILYSFVIEIIFNFFKDPLKRHLIIK